MPRTKINKTKKRSRGAHDEKLQEFEQEKDNLDLDLDDILDTAVQNIEDQLRKFKGKLPRQLLSMKLSDFRKMGVKMFSNVSETPSRNVTSVVSAKAVGVRSTLDEGYSTHEEESVRNSGSSSNQLSKPRLVGPFMSAQTKKRRSRSAQSSIGGTFTPKVNQFLAPPPNRFIVKRTGQQLLSGRLSRPKYRTPVSHVRKAASADRLLITPKVQPNTPMALLRHARTGEHVFSITGSPVITSTMGDTMANVNIPLGDAILSIRPTEMGEIDPSYISRIDKDTMNHLKQLQENIHRIMETAAQNVDSL